MTNKQKAQELIALVLDIDRPVPERTAALEELNALKKKAKVGWGALLGHQPSGSDDPNTWDDVKDLVNQAGFEATAEELAKQKPRQEIDPLDEEVVQEIDKIAKQAGQAAVAEVEVLAKAMGAKPPKPKKDGDLRGQISTRTKELLLASDEPYADIVEKVRKEFPHAVTTTRSLASVASEMRKAGKTVLPRRKAAKE